MLLSYFQNDYEMVPVAPIIAGATFVFAFHMRCISTVGLYISENSWIVSLSHLRLRNCKTSQRTFSFFIIRVIMYGLLLGLALSVCTCWY
jgi:hypothetical protein